MRIGIIGPCEEEIYPFINRLHDVTTERYAMLSFCVGKYLNTDVVAVLCGICKVNAAIAAQILVDKFSVTHIIVTGAAGAIDKNLKIFDTVISSEVAYHDVGEEELTKFHPRMEDIYFKADSSMLKGMSEAISNDNSIVIGRMVTGEAFIAENGRDEIIKKYNPLCVDMETASIAHVCYVNAIPFVAIRTISDTSEESISNKNFESAARKSIDVLELYLDTLNCRK